MSRLNHFSVHRHFWQSLIAAGLILILVGGSPSFASSPGRASHVKTGGTVTIVNVQGFLWNCGFNPYSTTVALLSAGIFYEPLWYINPLNGKEKPWLATKYAWSNGNKALTFTLRSGVKWSDGKPLTPADVVFTFKLLKKFSGVDLNAVWTVLSNVQAKGNTIVFTFKRPSVPFLYYIGDQTFILPEHIWSKVSNPVTFTNKNPVGSGPFLLSRCSPQNIEYVRNPHYWQKGKPYVSKIEYPAFMDNQPGNLYLAQGKAQWGAQYIPNIQPYYLQRGPNRHYWFPPGMSTVNLYPNLKVWPTNILAVRQAISYGIDRNKVSKLGVYGYLPVANQSGIILPNYQSWYDQEQAAKWNYSYRPQKAIAILQSAGFKRGSDGIFQDKSGRKLSISVINIGGYTDWVAEVNLIASSLKDIGIELKPENLTGDNHSAREQNGRFQLSYESPAGGPAPYYQFRQMLHSVNTAPIGKLAPSNFERFSSSAVDKLLNSYAATKDSPTQHQIINRIQTVMLQNVPVIPVLEAVNWFQYDTTQIVGWPTPQNPYAAPAVYNYPDQALIMMNLHLK
jgi:peptide/nickel transport system substrate-binding protein